MLSCVVCLSGVWTRVCYNVAHSSLSVSMVSRYFDAGFSECCTRTELRCVQPVAIKFLYLPAWMDLNALGVCPCNLHAVSLMHCSMSGLTAKGLLSQIPQKYFGAV